jgi:hypothetical protein
MALLKLYAATITLVSKETILGHKHPSASGFEVFQIHFIRSLPESPNL